MKKLPIFPPMQCDADCGECCTAFLCSESEYQRVGRYVLAKGIKPIAHEDEMLCPFYNGTCMVHEARPAICRAFGHSEKLVCSRGHNVNVDEKELERAMLSLGPPRRTLHELAEKMGAKVDAAEVRRRLMAGEY